jgi:GWxTD domain-containing protein
VNWRGVCILVGWAAVLAAAAPGRAAATGVRDAAVDRLERELATTANPDSIRLELAIAYRELGLVETRTRALELLDSIRDTYDGDPRYHRERAYAYLEGQRYQDARGELRRVIALDPGDASARVIIARLLFKIVLRYSDFVATDEVLDLLDSALEQDPNHRAALVLKAVVLQTLRGMRLGSGSELSLEAQACAAAVLARDPGDVDALLLKAISAFDLNDPDQAEALFQQAIRRMPTEAAGQFRAPWLIARPEVLATYRQLDDAGRHEFVRGYWQEVDPTPLTPANETQLEYWKRLTLADFYFGDPRQGTRGWSTVLGETFVRYGFPRQTDYEQAQFGQLSMEGGAAQFVPPAWVWHYEFQNRALDLVFRDVNLQGSFVAEDETASTLSALRERSPAVFHDVLADEMSQFFVSHAGFRHPPSGTRDQVAVAISPFGRLPLGMREDVPWWFGSRITAHVLDDRQETVATRRWEVGERDLAEPVAGAEMLLLDGSFDLAPGRYALVGIVENAETGLSGSFSQPFYVRSFSSDMLQVSDLELGLPTHAGLRGHTNQRLGTDFVSSPVGFVSGARGLGVYYEIYNLKYRFGNEVEFRVRYTVLPRGYVVGHSRRVNAGKAEQDDELRLGRLGASLDGITLTRNNYADVSFPPETVRSAPGAPVPRRARVPIALLEPGEYALVVTVIDVISGRSATSEAPFRVAAEPQLRDLLNGERQR